MPFALITGASGGIGAALAQEFAAHGWSLLLTARSMDKLQTLKQELTAKGVRVEVIALDLERTDSPARLEQAVDRLGIQIDALVNNAGFGDFGLFHRADRARLLAMLHLNISALTDLSHRFGTRMARQGQGFILNVASTAAFQPGPLMATYFSSKSYVLSFSQALALELGPRGVSVTALCPGPTATGFASAAHAEQSGLFGKRIPDARAVARFGYRAMVRRRSIAVHGWINWLGTVSARLLGPRLAARAWLSLASRQIDL
jgi:short-subunit dehydrogenase